MSPFVRHPFGSGEKNPRQIKRLCLPLVKCITTCRARPLRARLSSVRAINGPNGKTFGALFRREKTRPETKDDGRTKVRRKECGRGSKKKHYRKTDAAAAAAAAYLLFRKRNWPVPKWKTE